MQTERKRILIVDDEQAIRDSLKLLLKNQFEIETAENGRRALEISAQSAPDLVLLDILMPELDGMQTLKALREQGIKSNVIMLTASSTVKTAVQAMKLGAADFINKPFDVDELSALIESVLGTPNASDPSAPLQPLALELEGDFGSLVGRCAAMQDMFNNISQVAERDTTVLVTGESGTGKELVAMEIHRRSSRKNGPFIAINCAAIPESLIESELFGHERGAFTHAVERRVGYFELADGGTLFLDEIGELSLAVQVKMLRFLQEQEFYRVGRSKPIRVNVRIITATNRSLEELIIEKRFRQDLFYRINVINLNLPSLRDRFEDIPYLVEHFCKALAPCYSGRRITFSENAMNTLIQYDWPGNVRELENVVECLMALAPKDLVDDCDLPKKLKVRSQLEGFKTDVFEGDLKFGDAEKMFESEMIVKALKKTNYVQTRAAELLGISRRILKYKMDKLGISDSPQNGESEPDNSQEH